LAAMPLNLADRYNVLKLKKESIKIVASARYINKFAKMKFLHSARGLIDLYEI